jgi:hypothetical protein
VRGPTGDDHGVAAVIEIGDLASMRDGFDSASLVCPHMELHG